MQKFSRQRAEVLEVVRENLIHPTADEVYHLAREKNPHISLGTVYRNLNNLADDGEILKIHMPDGKCRFDGNIHEHYHAICQGCGRVTDFDFDLSALRGNLKSQNMFDLKGYEFVAYGMCGECTD